MDTANALVMQTVSDVYFPPCSSNRFNKPIKKKTLYFILIAFHSIP